MGVKSAQQPVYASNGSNGGDVESKTMPRRIALHVAAASDIGHVRPSNEDAHLIAHLGAIGAAPLGDAPDELLDPTAKSVLLAVADGMGGHRAGQIASALAIEALRRVLPPDSPDWNDALRAAVEYANKEVWTAGQDPSRTGMGSTLTVVCVHGVHAYLAEVGDSRAYLLRDGELRLLTHDQSYVQMLVDIGALKPNEAEHSPMKNVLLSAIGQHDHVKVDMGHLELRAADTLLLCCDGLSNEVAAVDICRVLERRQPPAETCAALIAMANDHGGNDNITVIVATVEAAS
jgi:serine/threonine protein phosphatase PrpC